MWADDMSRDWTLRILFWTLYAAFLLRFWWFLLRVMREEAANARFNR